MQNTHTPDAKKTGNLLQGRWYTPTLLSLLWIVWLPFLASPVIALLLSHAPLFERGITLAIVLLFTGFYVWATWQNAYQLLSAPPSPMLMTPERWWPVLVLAGLSVLLALLGYINNIPLIGSFIFTCAYTAGRLPARRVIQVNAGLALLAGALGWLTGANMLDLGQGLFLIAVISFMIISLIWSIMTTKELQAAREEIARLAVMTERLRIARDLHDLLGHNLSLIALKSELAGRLLTVAPERAAVEIGDIEKVTRTTLQEVREAVASYRQPTLANELHGVREILQAAGIAYHYQGDERSIDALPTPVEAVLAWIVREGVTNVIKHSRARTCTIRIQREKQDITVEIINDGVHMAAEPVEVLLHGTPIREDGHGLRGLAERVEALGGHCEAGLYQDDGFRLTASVPLVQGDSHTKRSNA